MVTRLHQVWNKGVWYLWLGLVLSLPITSFPIFAKVLHTSSVAPAAGIFLILIVILWFPVALIQKSRFPFHLKPLILFFFVAFISIGLAFFRDVPPFKSHSLISSAVEGLATLGLGFLFYLVTISIPNTEEKVKRTLQFINIGGAILLLWSLFQITDSLIFKDFPEWARVIQHQFSTTVLFDRRATGFASEPSWLAHELNLVYLAYWLSATLNKSSVHKFRFLRFTIENVLFVLGVITIIATFSRGGLVAFMLVIAFLFVRANISFAHWLSTRWRGRNRALISGMTGVLMVFIYLGIAVAGLYGLSKVDPRMEKVFQFSSTAENPLLKYAENLQFGERVVYWETGWNIFNDHPIIGVGVGFSGYYFPQYLPDYSWKLTEVRNLLYRSTGLLNIKSLWSRILAETGIIGFTLFLTFLVVTLFTARELAARKDPLQKTIGWMGILMLIAFPLEGFSVDSFALPYYWFTLGLVAACWRWLPNPGRLNSDG